MADPIKKVTPKAAEPSAADTGAPKKKPKGMLIGLIVGGVLLVTCCCTSGVGSLVVYFYVLPKGQEAAIVGRWRNNFLEYDFRSDGKLKLQNLTNGFQSDLVYKFIEPNVIEVKGDTGGNNMLNGQPYPIRRFTVTLSGNELTLRERAPDADPAGVKFKRS